MPREQLEIDENLVLAFARLGATNQEIGDYFECAESTIRNRFSEKLAKARSERNVKLRELQWNSAKNGNVTMQIFLGKQYLGQSDKVENSHNVSEMRIIIDGDDANL